MRRSTLSKKLFAAALPLVLAVAALLALTVRNDLRDLQEAENGAELGRVWAPLIGALGAVEAEVADARDAFVAIGERRSAIDAADGVMGNLGASEALAAERAAAAQYDAANEPMETADLAATRADSDAALDELVVAIDRLDGAESAAAYVTASRSSLLSGRRIVDRAILAPDMLAADSNPADAYERANRDLVAIGELLPSEAGDPELGAELLSVLKLARAKLAADDVLFGIDAWQANPADIAPLATARQSFADLENSIAEFEAVAPEEWLLQYRNSGFSSALAGFRADLEAAVSAVQGGQIASFDDAAFTELVRQGVGFQSAISQSIVERAEADVTSTRNSALTRIAVTLGVVLLALAIAWFISRSIARRVRAVAAGANQVASEQLPALVEALQDPRGKAVLPEIAPVAAKGNDELAELAEAFNSMQGTLVDVAHEQVEVLRRGVSDIFVTMARRNRSLIDRQLAMLDEYEAEVEDPDILANYYQLDHLATRMRRNSESLLVLANAEPKRKRVKATEIDDVVRASIGEVEDYRRVEIEALESLQVRGNVVADVSHLLAELLDNATSFSPPDSVVRVGGRRAGDTYMIRIVDDGVGIGTERMRELNDLLREPPIVGLSVESTLGMSVVSLLAHKHGIRVTLAAGNPGLTVDVVLPATVFGPIDVPEEMPTGAASPVVAAPTPIEEPIVDWSAHTTFSGDEDTFVPEHEQPPAPAPSHDQFGAEERRVVAGDLGRLSLDLSAFKSGMAHATDHESPSVDADESFVADADPLGMPDLPTRDTEAPAVETFGAPARAATPDVVDAPAPAAEAPTPSVFGAPAAEAPAPDIFDVPAPTAEAPTPATFDVPTPTAEAPTPAIFDVPAPAAEAPTPDIFDVPAPTAEAPTPATFDVPAQAPAPAARHGEFDRPLAPPMTASPLGQRPVAPADALAAPTKPSAPSVPGLPTRNPGSGRPDGGPDRLAEAPSALEDALNGGLPNRARVGDPMDRIEEPVAASSSRLDPDALRERLRAFQTEFRSGTDAPERGTDNHDTGDLGGDR